MRVCKKEPCHLWNSISTPSFWRPKKHLQNLRCFSPASARETFCFFVRPSKIVVESKNFKVSASKTKATYKTWDFWPEKKTPAVCFCFFFVCSSLLLVHCDKPKCSSKVWFWKDSAGFWHIHGMYPERGPCMTPFTGSWLDMGDVQGKRAINLNSDKKSVSWIVIKRLRLTTWEQYYFIIIHSIKRKS